MNQFSLSFTSPKEILTFFCSKWIEFGNKHWVNFEKQAPLETQYPLIYIFYVI